MSEKQCIQIKILTPEISENESDKAIFALFDLLLKNKEEVEEINNSDDNHGETT